MAEKRSSSGTPRRIRALLSSFIRHGKTDETKRNSESSTDKSPPTSVPTTADNSTKSKDEVSTELTPSRRSFRPLSSEDFFQRVQSYKAHTWFAKPSQLSPLQCARYGWENIEADTLKCMSCKELLYVGLPPQWETIQYMEACATFQESLTTAHSKICPWPGNASPESFLEIATLADVKEVVETYCNHVSAINGVGISLPDLDLSSMSKHDIFEPQTICSQLQSLVKEILGPDDADNKEHGDDVLRTSCLLALLGWQKKPTDLTCYVLMCQYCRRHAGVWNFLSLKETPADSTTEAEDIAMEEQDECETEEPQAKRLKKDSSKTKFNPVIEHRTWCPWICPSTNHIAELPEEPITEKNDSSEPITPTKDKTPDLGWQKLLDVLLRKADPDKYNRDNGLLDKSTTPPSQAWKTVRKLLSFWQSKDVEKTEEAADGEGGTSV